MVSGWRNEEGGSPVEKWNEYLSLMGNLLRLACQVIGVIVIFWGIGLASQIFADLWGRRDDPELLSKLAAPAEKYLGDQPMAVVGGEKVPLSRVASIVFVLGYHVLIAWIAMGIMVTGARMIAWNFDERRQLRVILQELLTERRNLENKS